MTEQPVIYTLYLSPGDQTAARAPDTVNGALDFAGKEVADFKFGLETANSIARDLREVAANWAEAHEQGDQTQDDLWQELHGLGARCFEWVFGDAADAVDQCLSRAPPGAELKVRQVDASLSIPWGLLCTPSDAKLARQRPLQLTLWSAKYNVRTNLDHGRAPHQRRMDGWRFEAVVCKKAYAADIERLAPESVPLARSILARSLNPSEPEQAPQAPPNCFIYAHSHSEFEKNEELKLIFELPHGKHRCQPIELVRRVAPLRNDAAVMAVLNACDSARGVENMGPALIGQSNFEIACIATEVPADRGFATEFGLELIDRCVQRGESTFSAMKAMRVRHYPLSVIYSHFCKADLMPDAPLAVFEAGDLEAYRASIENANYSYRQRPAP